MTTDFRDGDIIITEHFAAKLTGSGRGRFAEVADAGHPMNGAHVFGDKWFVPEFVEKVSRGAPAAAKQ